MEAIAQANYAFAKQACYRCLSGGPLVDLDVFIEGEGCLALCHPCVGEAAQIAGFKVIKPKTAAAK